MAATQDTAKSTTTFGRSRRTNLALATLAAIAGLVAVWPPIHLVIVDANLPTYYMENIGWRFFWVQRFVAHVPGDYVHPGQGVLLPLIQSIYYILGKSLGLDLFGQISLFGYLTLTVAAVALLVTTSLIALDDRIDPGVRAALVTTPLVMGLGDSQIFAYDVYPDYLAYTKVLFLVFGWRWLHYRAWEMSLSRHGARELGFLAGLMGALKINYLLWPAGLLLISLIASDRTEPGAAQRRAVDATLYAALSMGGSFLIFYYGNPLSLLEFFRVLLAWVPSLTGSLSFAITPALVRVVAAAGVLCLLRLSDIRARPAGLLIAVIAAALGGAAILMAYWRGGSSTFDAVVMVCILCPIIAATFGRQFVGSLASFAVTALFIAWPAAWAKSHWNEYSSVAVSGHQPLVNLSRAGDWQRHLYNWDMSWNLPVYVLTPTNYETQGSIEDMISLGGIQNFGGAPAGVLGTLEALYPRIHFLYYDSPGYHISLPPQRVVFLHVTGEAAPDFPQLDPKTRKLHDEEEARLLRGRRQESCYTVKQFMTRQTIVSCVLSAPLFEKRDPETTHRDLE